MAGQKFNLLLGARASDPQRAAGRESFSRFALIWGRDDRAPSSSVNN
jgi:hypothetical protein